jgi:solute carrier family 25 aspartate/glutamate transporter 12/13
LARLDDILNTNDECEDELQDSQSQGRQDGNDIPASSDQMVTDPSPVPGSGRLLFLNRLLGYDDLISFQEALDQLPTFCDLIQRASQFKRKSLSFDDCLVSNQTYGSGLSTFQMQILFQLFDTDQDGLVSRQDTVKVLGWDPNYRLERTKSGALRMSSTQSDLPQSWLAQEWAKGSTSFFGQARTCFEHFTLITLTSGFAAFALYPFDLVKTRMMNQQTHKLAWTLYKNSFDCFLKTVRIEGLWGLYRGILPQLLGVGPEKMIKLAVNDLLREAFMDERTAAEGNAQWWLEILTGGCAGACQVLVTNPMEVAKIRLQVQGETRNVYMAQGRHVSTSAQTLTAVSARLGLAGHYRGVAACLLRDVPFSAIFFPTFAYCKDTLYHHNQGCSEATNLILAGSFAAIPATLVTNPADVIKTRLQVLRRDDHTAYVGIRDGFVKIYQQEGPSAFYKGCLARMLRTVPQFGVTVWTYEILTRAVGLQRLSAPPTDAPISPQDFHSAFR